MARAEAGGGRQRPLLLSHVLILPFYLLNENMWLNSQTLNGCKIQFYPLTEYWLSVDRVGTHPAEKYS